MVKDTSTYALFNRLSSILIDAVLSKSRGKIDQGAEEGDSSKLVFHCPAHECAACGGDGGGKDEKLLLCAECPNAHCWTICEVHYLC